MSYIITTGTGAITTSTHSGACYISGPLTYTASPQKAPMLEPQPCPLCKNPAVRNADGSDWLIGAGHDHKPRDPKNPPRDCEYKHWEPSGVDVRIRVCATCGHLWATRTLPPVEQPCTPGK